jgi:alkylated DNA repair dioxygenase AlkB
MIHLEKGALSESFCEYLSLNVDMMMKFLGYPEDKHIRNSVSYYAPIFYEALLLQLQPKIEEIVGKKLHPCYSYSRVYLKGSELPPHIDRAPGEYGVTICIEKDTPWPIHFKVNGELLEYELEPGDMCVYSGMEHEHWRHLYRGYKHSQCFLVYVDAEGEYADWKYDKRSDLAMPKQ